MFKFKNFFSLRNHGWRPLRPSKRFQANGLYIHVSGRPKKGKYSGLTNAQKMSALLESLVIS